MMRQPLAETVSGLIEDARHGEITLPQFSKVSEPSLIWTELVFCIVSSQERTTRARLAANLIGGRMSEHKILTGFGSVEEILAETQVRLRFHNRKIEHICASWERFQSNSLELLDPERHFTCESDARDFVMSEFSGLGPKQASMFLRNIGYGNSLAVIDSHVAWTVEVVFGIPDGNKNWKKYLETEQALRYFADGIDLTVAALDVILWSASRAFKNSKWLRHKYA
jgi:N-glycosylase/DNA lyase